MALFVSKWGDTRNCYFDLGNDDTSWELRGFLILRQRHATACNGMQRNMNDSTLHRHSGTEL
jgi:hypothetical protein